MTEREQVDQQMLLGGEVMEQPRRAHVDSLGDQGERRAAVAVLGEHVARGTQDLLPAKSPGGIRSALAASRGKLAARSGL